MLYFNLATIGIAVLSILINCILFYYGRRPLLRFETKIDEVENHFTLQLHNYGGPAKVIDQYIDFNNNLYRNKNFQQFYDDILNIVRKFNDEYKLNATKFRQNISLCDGGDSLIHKDSKNNILIITGFPPLHLIVALQNLKVVTVYKSTLPFDFITKRKSHLLAKKTKRFN